MKIMSDMGDFFKAKKTSTTPMEASKSDKARPEGNVSHLKYRNYYDVNSTITTAQATDPNDQDNANYNQEQIFVALERNAETLHVCNDGIDDIFAIVSHEGGQNFARERPIYPGEMKTFYNVYEIRLRSPTAGTAYRVTEYNIEAMCCPGSTANFAAAKTTEGEIVAASTTQRFRLDYIQITASNNDGQTDGLVTLSGTVGGNTVNIAALRVPIGANNFSTAIATDCNILFDTNTALNVAVAGTITFNLQVAGRYV